MGQALWRASGRARSSSLDPSPQVKKVERHPRAIDPKISKNDDQTNVPESVPESIQKINNEVTVLEERDPKYDAMLNNMVGRITSKPGGKLEMGEAFIVERYNRPMPKLRRAKEVTGQDEGKEVPPGTLKIEQVRHIILLHLGKADDHSGPMDAPRIAEKFRIDVEHVQKILQALSLPPEDVSKNANHPS